MVSVEDHGDRLAELVEFAEESGGRPIRQGRALLVGFDGFLLVVLQRLSRGGGGFEVVVLVPVMVGHVVLHGDDLQELVRLGFPDFLQRALVGGLVGDVRRIVDLVLMRDDVRPGQRVEMREAELLVVGGARIHGRFVRVQADGVLCGAPHLVDCRRPMLARHQLLVWAGQGGIEIRHAQAGQSHVFQIGGAAAVSGGQHQAGRGILLNLANVRYGILVDFESRHAGRVGEGFGQHVDDGAVGHVRGTFRVDLLRGLLIAGRDLLHGLFGIVVRLDHDFRVELTGERHQRPVALGVVYGVPHGGLVPHDGGEAFGPRADGAHLHRIQREEQAWKQDQQQSCDRVHGTGSLIGAAKQSAVTRVEAVQEDEQRHERGKRRHRDQNGPLRAGRHETHQIAGVGFEEVQVAWQNRLVSNRHFEMLNHGDDERHRQKYRRGHPETVGEHEQDHVQDAPQYEVEHSHKISAGEHLADESPAGEPHVVR